MEANIQKAYLSSSCNASTENNLRFYVAYLQYNQHPSPQ